jgi:hypothetical protein
MHAALVAGWAAAGGHSKLQAALDELTKLRLLVKAAQGGQAEWKVDAAFQAQLRRAMSSGWAPLWVLDITMHCFLPVRFLVVH